MTWYYCTDSYYYTVPPKKWSRASLVSFVKSALKERFKYVIGYAFPDVEPVKEDVVLVMPTESELREAVRKSVNESGSTGLTIAVVSPNLPPKEFEKLFVVKEMPNAFGSLTTQQKAYVLEGSTEEERKAREKKILENYLGLKMYKPRIDFSNMVGMSSVKRYITSIHGSIKNRKTAPKGIFLVGLPGTGKSFSAKVAASALNWYLVELNVSKILESANPITTLHNAFLYLESNYLREIQGKSHRDRLNVSGYVLWIDEIEKMFSTGSGEEKRVFGQLLTILNDLNTETGYKLKGVFWVTANDIEAIAKKNPEFLRKGRFDQLFFVDTPKDEDAEKLFSLYQKVFRFKYYPSINKDGQTGFGVDGREFTELVYSKFIMEKGSPDVSRFIYTPAEIAQIAKEMAIRQRQKLTAVKLLKEYRKFAEKSKTALDDGRKKTFEKLAKDSKKELEDLLSILYPNELVWDVLGLFISHKIPVPVYDSEILEKVENAHSKNKAVSMEFAYDQVSWAVDHLSSKKGRTVLNAVDLLITIKQNPPIMITLQDAIANMRSKAKDFVPADV